jgi:hypothetical protein
MSFESNGDISVFKEVCEDSLSYLMDDGYKIRIDRIENGEFELKIYPDLGNIGAKGGYMSDQSNILEPHISELKSHLSPLGFEIDYTYNSIAFLSYVFKKIGTKSKNRLLYLPEAKKLTPSKEFEEVVNDVMVDAIDNGFLIVVDNALPSAKFTNGKRVTGGTTFTINITKNPLDDRGVSRFRFNEIKNDLIMLVSYLMDVYPKMRFTSFYAGPAFSGYKPGVGKYYTLESFIEYIESEKPKYIGVISISLVLRQRGKKI